MPDNCNILKISINLNKDRKNVFNFEKMLTFNLDPINHLDETTGKSE